MAKILENAQLFVAAIIMQLILNPTRKRSVAVFGFLFAEPLVVLHETHGLETKPYERLISASCKEITRSISAISSSVTFPMRL
jgi:hypothetical protein